MREPIAFGIVPKLWPGETVVCIGGGPSLTAEDVAYCQGKARVIAVNDAYRLAPWADVLYACDAKWWNWHKGVSEFQGLKYALDTNARAPRLQLLKNTGKEGLELNPKGLRTGSNSGYQAINLAVHFGATQIILLGYDMQRTGGREHWFGDHPTRAKTPYLKCIGYFNGLAPILKTMGIRGVNCSRQSALTCFPRASLRETLPDRLEMAS